MVTVKLQSYNPQLHTVLFWIQELVQLFPTLLVFTIKWLQTKILNMPPPLADKEHFWRMSLFVCAIFTSCWECKLFFVMTLI